MQAILDRKMEHFIHITIDRLGLAGWSSVFLTFFTVAEFGIIVPMAMSILMVGAQGYRWTIDNKRKQKRHDLYISVMEKMVEKMNSGEIPYDQNIIDKLAAEDAD